MVFYTDTTLYCMVTEAEGCKQLAQNCYVALHDRTHFADCDFFSHFTATFAACTAILTSFLSLFSLFLDITSFLLQFYGARVNVNVNVNLYSA